MTGQSHADEIIESSNSAFTDLKRRVIHAEDRLLEIKSELRELNTSVKELNATISNMGKPHFQTWAAIGSLIAFITSGAWFLAINPINDRLTRFDTQLDKNVARLENDIAERATKDDLNRLIIETDRRLPKARGK